MTTEQTILLADDDPMIVDALRYQLQKEGYKVVTAFDGAEALDLARSCDPSIVLLDVMMPKIQGWEVCRELRQESDVPILMLTARDEEMDRVLGLELGADDYIVKPFSFRELLARIRANLRRAGFAGQAQVGTHAPNADEAATIGHLTIDRRRRLVTKDGGPTELSPKEFELLLALLDAHGGVVPRNELLDQVWGQDWIGDPRTLDVHIRWLRGKLEPNSASPRYILTARGVGYRLVTADEVDNDNR